MINFLTETLEAIKRVGLTTAQITWIGSDDGKYDICFNEFKELSNFEYDNSYGGVEIVSNIVIVFKDNSYFTRSEYDGSEWWAYHKTPILLEFPRNFTKLETTHNYFNIGD